MFQQPFLSFIVMILIKFIFCFTESSKSEEPSPVAVPFSTVVTPPKATTPAPIQPLHQEKAEDKERPSERTTVPEIRPELSKAPLHTTLSNSIVDAISIPHVTNTLPGKNHMNKTDAKLLYIYIFGYNKSLIKEFLVKPDSVSRSSGPHAFSSAC